MVNLGSLFVKLGSAKIWRNAVKGVQPVALLLVRVVGLLVGRVTQSWVIVLYTFSRAALAIYRTQGPRGLALRLKSSQLLLMQALAGKPHHATQVLGPSISRNRRGLPRMIPSLHRRAITSGSRLHVRVWLTLFGMYRVLVFRGAPKLSTITSPGVSMVSLLDEIHQFLPGFITLLKRFSEAWVNAVSLGKLVGRVRNVTTAGAPSGHGVRNSFAMAASASIHWLSSPLYSNFVAYCEETGNGRWASIVQRFAKFQGDGWSVPTVSRVELGRLAFKEEAAGKVRVFALVDYWTQLVLYPLHALMGKILREIPQDGTFDQARPLLRLVESMKDRGLHSCWSYDLSAATDRLPVDLQEILLAALFTPRMAANWKAILVGREYWLPKEHGYAGVPEGAPVSYAVGQPMGAYSSWTALALTHHFIVQWASWRASKGSFSWFADYAVLGDDVVIANRAVAREYRLLMHQLGVTISLPKSLESHNLSLEFAKRFIWKGEDCSPLSIKEFSVALGHLDTFVSMIGKVSSWMGGVRLATAVGTLGFGYRVKSTMFAPLKSLGKRIQGTLLMLTAPGKAFGVDSFTEWVAQRKLGESLELTQSEQAKIMLCLISKAWLPLHDRIVRVSSQYQFHQEAMLRPGLQGGPNGLYAETMVSPLYADASRDLHLAGMITWSTLHEVELTGVPPSHWTVNGLAWVWEETKLVNKVCMRVPSQILVREQLETEDVPHVGFAPGRLLAIYRMAWRKALVGR